MISIKKILTVYSDKCEYDNYLLDLTKEDPKVSVYQILTYLKTNKAEYEPSPKDKIYFLPDCTVPRFKIKKLCEEYNTAVVKFIDKATNIFYGPNTVKSILETSSYLYKVDRNKLIMRINIFTPDIQHYIYQCTDDFLFVDNFYFHDLQLNGGDFYTTFSDKNESILLKILNGTYKHQDGILSLINSGNILNAEQYESIKRLFNSTEQDQQIAIETLANCDYQYSSAYILLLLQEFGNTIYYNKASNHINFKALLQFFNLKSRELSYLTIKKIWDILAQHKFINYTNIDILHDQTINSIHYHDVDKYITVDSIKLTEYVYGLISENVLDGETDTIIISDDENMINPHYKINTND